MTMSSTMRSEDSAVIRKALSVVDRFDQANKDIGDIGIANVRSLDRLLEQAMEDLRIALVRAGHKPSMPPE